MAKDPESVKKFLADMSVKLQPIWLAEKDEMLKLKEEEVIMIIIHFLPNLILCPFNVS